MEIGGPYATLINNSILITAVASDPEGRPLTYEWDLDGDGIFEWTPEASLYRFDDVDSTGIYPIAVQVTDIGGLTAVDSTVVVVYDPNGPFVTGGGWINAPDGKGEFSFSAKYVKRNPYPVGEVSYVVESSGLTFTSTSFNWLVVAGRYSLGARHGHLQRHGWLYIPTQHGGW